MPGLGETTARLAWLKRQLQAHAPGAGDEGRMSDVDDFGPNPGALRMLAYAPQDLPAGAPLVVVLHGCTQRAEAHAAAAGWLTLADRCGFAVIAPEQTPANNPNRCFNWFEPADASRDHGEAASIRAMAAHAVELWGLDPRRVFVTGLSAGGAMAAVMLASYPEDFAGGAVIAGAPYGVARNLQEALSVMHGSRHLPPAELGALVGAAGPQPARLPRLSVWHGDLDRTVSPTNGTDAARQWAVAQGLRAEPDEVEALPGRTRSVWRAPTGEPVVELNLVAGLGHGTPLATTGDEGVGAAAPYMIESGVSSSLEIARFWGLAPAGAPVETVSDHLSVAPEALATAEPHLAPSVGEVVMSAVSPHVSADVQAVISDALKRAGLVR